MSKEEEALKPYHKTYRVNCTSHLFMRHLVLNPHMSALVKDADTKCMDCGADYKYEILE